MPERRRLRAAERRLVDGVVAGALVELEPVVAKMETVLVDRLVALPVELREPAVLVVLSEWGTQLYTGAMAGMIDGGGVEP
jgi:hypothetical protein